MCMVGMYYQGKPQEQCLVFFNHGQIKKATPDMEHKTCVVFMRQDVFDHGGFNVHQPT